MTIDLEYLLNTEPQCLIGRTHDGGLILEMSRAHLTHPGEWGHVVRKAGYKAQSCWVIPDPARHLPEEGPNQ